jgi:hypothetical protein
MFETLSTGSTAAGSRAAQPAPASSPEIAPVLPRQAKTVRDTGPRTALRDGPGAQGDPGRRQDPVDPSGRQAAAVDQRAARSPQSADRRTAGGSGLVRRVGHRHAIPADRTRPARRRRRPGALPLCRSGPGHARVYRAVVERQALRHADAERLTSGAAGRRAWRRRPVAGRARRAGRRPVRVPLAAAVRAVRRRQDRRWRASSDVCCRVPSRCRMR